MEVILMKNYTTCFFGHRKIDETEELKNNLRGIIENLIVKDINNREDIEDETCFVSLDDKLVIKYFIEDKKVTVLAVDIIT